MPLRNFHVHGGNSGQATLSRSDESGLSAREAPSLEEPTELTVPGNNAGYVGVKGWLLFLMLELAFLGPLFYCLVIVMSESEMEGQFPQLSASLQWTHYKALLWFTYSVLAGISIWGGWGLAQGREWSSVTRAKVVLWVIGPFGTVIIWLLPYAVFGHLIDRVDSDLIPNLIGHTVVASAWTIYLSTSKRVRATYTRSLAFG